MNWKRKSCGRLCLSTAKTLNNLWKNDLYYNISYFPSSQIILDIAKCNIDLLQHKPGFAQFLALSQTINNVRNQRPSLKQKYSKVFMGEMRLQNTIKIPFILSMIISHPEHKLYLHLLPNYFLIEFHNRSIFCFIFDLIGKGVPNKRTQLF